MSKELRFPRVNNVVLSARLTKDVELRYTASGKAVAKLSVAFDRSYKKDNEWIQESSFINVTAWEKLAEKCGQDLSKGSPILIEGYLKMNSWQDKNNNTRNVIEIISHKISFLEKSEVRELKHEYKDSDTPF